jgi:DNA-binding transcriptional LysR family regulator
MATRLRKGQLGRERILMSSPRKTRFLDYLETLVQFAERGEATVAARQLKVTKAVVSRRLKFLRTRYGLLAKQGTKQTLSPRALEALPEIKDLLRRYHALEESLTRPAGRPGVLVVGTGSLAAQLYLPQALELFTGRHPAWQIQVQVRRGRERILGAADGALDLALLSHGRLQIEALLRAARGEGARLEVEDLSDEPLGLIAQHGSAAGERLAPILEGQTVPLTLLSEFELVGLDTQSGVRQQLEQHPALGGRRLHFHIEGGGWAAVREYVRRGLGAAVVPLSLLKREDRRDLEIRLLDRALCLTERLIYRPGPAGPEREALREAVREAVKLHQERQRVLWQGLLPV